MDYERVLGKLRSFNVKSSKAAENKAYRSACFGSSGGAFLSRDIDYDRMAQHVLKAMKASGHVPDVVQEAPLSPLEVACCKLSKIPNDV